MSAPRNVRGSVVYGALLSYHGGMRELVGDIHQETSLARNLVDPDRGRKFFWPLNFFFRPIHDPRKYFVLVILFFLHIEKNHPSNLLWVAKIGGQLFFPPFSSFPVTIISSYCGHMTSEMVGYGDLDDAMWCHVAYAASGKDS